MENNFNENGFTPYESEPVANEFGGEAAPETPEKKDSLLKKLLIPGIALIAVIAIALVLLLGGGSYKTPVNYMQKISNAKSASAYYKATLNSLNGFCESEVKSIFNIMKKSDQWEDMEENMDEMIEGLKDQYGDNYKFKYTIKDKEKIDKDDLEDYEDGIKESGEQLEKLVEQFEDFDDDELEELAEESGISKSNYKKMVKAMEKIAKKFGKAKVTAGYELEVEVKITGSELDEPEEEEMTVIVLKINGRWVSLDSIGDALDFF